MLKKFNNVVNKVNYFFGYLSGLGILLYGVKKYLSIFLFGVCLQEQPTPYKKGNMFI